MHDDDFTPAQVPALTERQLGSRREHLTTEIRRSTARSSSRRRTLRRPSAFALAAAAAALLSAGAALAVQQLRAGDSAICDVEGEWGRSDDATWLHSRLASAGFSGIGCTGSAFVVEVHGSGGAADAYVWTTRPAKSAVALARDGYHETTAVGATAVWTDGTRLVWRVGDVLVWASAGPSTVSALTVPQISSVVSSTTASPPPAGG